MRITSRGRITLFDPLERLERHLGYLKCIKAEEERKAFQAKDMAEKALIMQSNKGFDENIIVNK